MRVRIGLATAMKALLKTVAREKQYVLCQGGRQRTVRRMARSPLNIGQSIEMGAWGRMASTIPLSQTLSTIDFGAAARARRVYQRVSVRAAQRRRD